MTNPAYKFFHDELSENEILRYDNDKVIKFEPSTQELKEGAERIIKELESRGFRKMKSTNINSISFSKPEFCKAAYVGTTVNPFSFNDEIWLWTNEFAVSKKFITLTEVHKHNGANNNASFRITVNYANADKKPQWHTAKWHNSGGKVNAYGVKIPSTYEYVEVGGNRINCEEIRKFKPSISDKVIKNILDKAEESLNNIEIFDPSIYEADSSKFPAATSEDYVKLKRK